MGSSLDRHTGVSCSVHSCNHEQQTLVANFLPLYGNIPVDFALLCLLLCRLVSYGGTAQAPLITLARTDF